MHMWAILGLLVAIAEPGEVQVQPALPPADGSTCLGDYVTVETVRGTIIEIKPAPEPFLTADIYLSAPLPCNGLWMQVLKTDAERCTVGRPIEAKGIITADPDADSWDIGSPQGGYMVLGTDFSCD